MQYTSSEANKLLKKLNADYQALLETDYASRTYLAATGEDPDSVKPEYDYKKMQEDITALSEKIGKVKHAINIFNSNTVIEGFDMTIDELLIRLPMINERVRSLDVMRRALPKVRKRSYGAGTGATIDYEYTNYDREEAVADYEKLFDYLSKAQTALDHLNTTVTFEIEI